MMYDWINRKIESAPIRELGAKAAAYASRIQEIERFWQDPTQRQVQYFITVLEDPKSPCQQRMGWLPRLDRPLTRQEFMEDSDLNLRVQLTLLDRRMAAGLGDIWTPSLWPLFGRSHCSGAFGCQERFVNPSDYPWIDPALDTPEDIYAVQPDLRKSRVAQRVLKALHIWREITEDLIPVRVPEVVEPFTGSAEIIGDMRALQMVITQPEVMHNLLGKYATVTQEWISRQLAAAGDSPHWGTFHVRLPKRQISLAADTLVLLSPAHLREFAVPYIIRAVDGLDGFFAHYCGGNTHLLPVLREIPGFRGVDSQFGLQQYPMARQVLGPVAVILSLVVDGPPGTLEVRPEFLRQYLEMVKGDRTILWLRAKSVEEARRLEEMVHRYAR